MKYEKLVPDTSTLLCSGLVYITSSSVRYGLLGSNVIVTLYAETENGIIPLVGFNEDLLKFENKICRVSCNYNPQYNNYRIQTIELEPNAPENLYTVKQPELTTSPDTIAELRKSDIFSSILDSIQALFDDEYLNSLAVSFLYSAYKISMTKNDNARIPQNVPIYFLRHFESVLRSSTGTLSRTDIEELALLAAGYPTATAHTVEEKLFIILRGMVESLLNLKITENRG